jgi:SsrA-binding protein
MALSENRKARFDYEVLKKFSAGLELSGPEVKSARAGKMTLAGAFVAVRGGEAFLIGATIPPYQPQNKAGQPLGEYDGTRARKLLLTKGELAELADAEGTKGLTIVPISVYNKGRFLKADIAIARGKKLHDKRQSEKKRQAERDQGRTL